MCRDVSDEADKVSETEENVPEDEEASQAGNVQRSYVRTRPLKVFNGLVLTIDSVVDRRRKPRTWQTLPRANIKIILPRGREYAFFLFLFCIWVSAMYRSSISLHECATVPSKTPMPRVWWLMLRWRTPMS